MTIKEAGLQIEAAIRSYGPAALNVIDRILDQVKSEHGHEAANALIEDHDLELRCNIAPEEFDIGTGE
ncbi:MAG TPA: hypothetical protein VLB09_09820 [Nitrospiria bacterium]|nr:hypothetical protein [Nitrospiria bacterium]